MTDPDHRLMSPPSLRVARSQTAEAKSSIAVWDLRIAQPNVSHVDSAAIHSLEHFLGSILPKLSPAVVNVAPMGCQTGFYIVTVAMDDFETLSTLLSEALAQVCRATEVPLANNRECGWANNHSLTGAQNIADWLLRHRASWRCHCAGEESAVC